MSRSRLHTVCPPPLCACTPLVSVPPFCYLRCFKSDFNAVKRKIDLLKDYIPYCVPVSFSVCPLPVSVPPFCYLRYFKLELKVFRICK